jgi:hypothetical protein
MYQYRRAMVCWAAGRVNVNAHRTVAVAGADNISTNGHRFHLLLEVTQKLRPTVSDSVSMQRFS